MPDCTIGEFRTFGKPEETPIYGPELRCGGPAANIDAKCCLIGLRRNG